MHVDHPLQGDDDRNARAVRRRAHDFGPARSKVWRGSADNYLQAYEQGSDEADVKEGSSGIWERLDYDWSNPNRVVLTTTDPNVLGGHSGYTYTLTRRPDGTTDVNAVIAREGR